MIDGRPPEAAPMPLLLYLDQNYLSGMVKRKPHTIAGLRWIEEVIETSN